MAKAIKKQALGRGLSALLKDPENDIKSVSDKNADKVVGNIVELELDSISVNPFQPRLNFNEDAIQQLASSIKELGLIQPITVRKDGFDKYQLVSGERRYRASKLLGLNTIPSYIRIANDQELLEMALVENIQRQDLDPIEIALSYKRLIEEISLTQESLSIRVGKKRSTIANYLRLLKLDPIIQTGMRDGFIGMGHGRTLINIEDLQAQLDIYEKVIAQSLSVRATEQLVKKYKTDDKSGNSEAIKTNTLPDFAKRGIKEFSELLDTSAEIKVSPSGKGKIIISFVNKNEYLRISKLLKSEN